MLSAAQERVRIDPFCCTALARGKIKEGELCPAAGWWEKVEGVFNLNSERCFCDGAGGLADRQLEEG